MLSFLLRVVSAFGGAASETAAMSIVIEEFPDRIAMASVRLLKCSECKTQTKTLKYHSIGPIQTSKRVVYLNAFSAITNALQVQIICRDWTN